jgi:transposase
MIIKVGMDVHAEKVAMCVQVGGTTPKPAQLVATSEALGWLMGLRKKYPQGQLVTCYEAGPMGFVLHRQLQEKQITNYVVVPQKLDERGKRQKTDRLDARALVCKLNRYVEGDREALGIVRVPTEAEELARAKSRQREQLAKTRRSHEARGRSAMLLHGIRVKGPWWAPRRWAQLEEELPAALKELVVVWRDLAVEADRLEKEMRKQLEAAAPKQLPKGVGALTWTTLSREIRDWSRFTNRRQVASYTGLCPGISQSGARSYGRCINRCGNRTVRRALLEMVWRMTQWQPQYPPVRALVTGCLSARQRRKHAVAAARRLAIDLWRLATGQCTAAELKLDPDVPLTWEKVMT